MKQKINILLLGRGGREAAIAWKLMKSERLDTLFTAPMSTKGAVHAEGLDPMDFEAVRDFVEQNNIDLVVVGPENPIVAGIADALGDIVKVIAPDAACARLEGSKEFAKEFMSEMAIPTARFMTVTNETLKEGFGFLDSLNPPYVLKADGLAGGKGVLIIDDLNQAKDALEQMLGGMFGNASETVVIEEFLTGRECSVFLAVDGDDYIVLPVARDHKRVGEGDTGPNTGGMGAVSPVDYADKQFMDKVERQIIIPTLRGLRERDLDYRGFMFLGLINVNGEPMVIEYNVRLGDPETEAIMPLIESDLIDLLEGIADRTLALKKVSISPESSAAVVVCTKGYPGPSEEGGSISGLEIRENENVIADDPDTLFFAGAAEPEGEGLKAGKGRIGAVVAKAATPTGAAAKAMKSAETVIFNGCFFRHDIGHD